MEASATKLGSVVRFGVFELDARSGELRRSGVLVNLQDQPLKVLECLLERPGELVTREALRQRLWPGDTFVDFEQGVNAAVKRLRETLADSAESPRFVETLPRRGYRFIAPVEHDDRDREGLALSAPYQPALVGKQTPPAVVKTQRVDARRWRHGVIAAGAIALVLLTISVWLRRASPETPMAPLRVVALTTLTGSEYNRASHRMVVRWHSPGTANSRTTQTFTSSLSGPRTFDVSLLTLPTTQRLGGLPTGSGSRTPAGNRRRLTRSG